MSETVDVEVLPEDAHANAANACGFLRSISHPYRLIILCLLMKREYTVGELCHALGEDSRQSVVSQHLGRLRQEELVEAHRDGNLMRYSLKHPAAPPIVAAIYEQFSNVAAND